VAPGAAVTCPGAATEKLESPSAATLLDHVAVKKLPAADISIEQETVVIGFEDGG
jgi:hypothetical protein